MFCLNNFTSRRWLSWLLPAPPPNAALPVSTVSAAPATINYSNNCWTHSRSLAIIIYQNYHLQTTHIKPHHKVVVSGHRLTRPTKNRRTRSDKHRKQETNKARPTSRPFPSPRSDTSLRMSRSRNCLWEQTVPMAQNMKIVSFSSIGSHQQFHQIQITM